MRPPQSVPDVLRSLLLPLYLPSALFALTVAVLVPVLPLFANSFTEAFTLVGLMLAAGSLGTLIGDVPAGLLLQRLGVRRAMLLGVFGVMVTTVGLFWAGSAGAVIALRLLTGLSIALYNVARHTYLSAATSTAQRGRAIAFFGGMFRLGRLIGPAVGGFIGAALGLRAAFLLAGAISLTALVVVFFFTRPEAASPHPDAPTPSAADLWRTLRGNARALLTGGMGQLFAQMVRAGWVTLLPLYGANVLGLEVDQIGVVVSALSAIDFALFFPAGMIMDRVGRKYAIVPSFGLQAVGMLLLPLTTSFGGMLAVALLIGFGNGLGAGTMMTLGADLAPAGARGEFLGLWRVFGDSGFTGAPLVVGGVADALTLPAASLAIAGAGLTAVLIFGLLLPETLHKQPQAA